MKVQTLRMLSLVTLLAVLAFAGCATPNDGAAAGDREVALQQRYHIDVVRARATDLRPGMSKAEVYTLLGAPAEYANNTWVYRGGVDGGTTFRVKFDGDRYTGHSGG